MPRSRLTPTRDKATIKLRDATASPGKGFSLASDNNRVDIFDLQSKLYRIVHINPDPRDVSRAEAHKRVFNLFGWRGTSEREAAFPVRKQRPQPEKGSDMLNHRLAFFIIAAASFSNAFAFAQENQGSPEQRFACAPDAFRLCASYIPDAAGVEACLRQRKSELSDACRTVFEQAAATASVRTTGSRRPQGARDEE
jgi:hypothetical protein